MARIHLQKNGTKTILFAGEDINSITPSASTFFVGTDLATGKYEKLNPNGDIIDLEGGSGTTAYFTVTKAESDALVSGSSLTEGAFYKITGVDPALYGGTDIILQATSINTLSKRGLGLFYNPRYEDYGVWKNTDKLSYSAKTGNFTVGESLIGNNGQTGVLATLPGSSTITIYQDTGNWTTATQLTGLTTGSIMNITGYTNNTTYNIGDKAIWGGTVWENLNGNVGVSIDMFTLDVEWSAITYNQTDYNLVADVIDYQYETDLITYRKDTYNEVINTDGLNNGFQTIKYFPWGNINVLNCTIIDNQLYDDNQTSRNLLNFNNGSILDFKSGIGSVITVDYWGDGMFLGLMNIGDISTFSGVTFGDSSFVVDIQIGNFCRFSNVNIANNDNDGLLTLTNIKLNGGYSEESIDGSTSIFDNVNMYPNTYINNLEIGSGNEYPGSFSNIILNDGASVFNVKVGDTSSVGNVVSSGVISNITLGQGTVITNLSLNSNSIFNNVILKGGNLNNPPYSYIENVNLVDSNFISFDVGMFSHISNIDLNDSTFYNVTMGPLCYIDTLSASTSDVFNINMIGGIINSPAESYITNLTLNNNCSVAGLTLGVFSKIDSIALNDNDLISLINLGDFNIMTGITFTGTGSSFNTISTSNNCSIYDITIGGLSNFNQLNLGNNSEIYSVTIGTGSYFNNMSLKGNTSIGNILLEDNSTMSGIETGLSVDINDIYIPSGESLSNIIIEGNLSLLSFTGSSLTSDGGYIIGYENNTFPANLDITGLDTIDMSSIGYAGKVNLITSNPSEVITGVTSIIRAFPVEFTVNSGSDVTFSATPVGNLTNNQQFISDTTSVIIYGDTYDYVVIKNIKDNYLQIVDSKNNI